MPELRNSFAAALRKLYGMYFCSVFVLCAIGTLTLITFAPGQQRRRGLARAGARLVFRLTAAWPAVEGIENLPGESSVVIANHASYLDGVLLTAVLPHRYQFVIKREVASVPLMHFFLRRIGALFVDRFDTHRAAGDTRRILQITENGASLAFFPEGTFRNEPGLRRFHSGAFTIAVRNNLSLVPITIRGTRRMLPGDKRLPRPARLSVRVHREQPTARGQTDVQQILQQCRNLILEQLDEPDHLHRSAAS